MHKLILVSIFILAFILRFWQLGANPPSLDWDEASLGYNAYSILRTGKDEYGNILPLSIRSFGDYKPPLYTYLTTIPVAMFGLNEFSTRFVSSFFGFLTVVSVYFLIKELFPKRSYLFSVLCSLFFALSPWHIQFSRIAFEANLALFFSISGIWLFLLGLRKQIYFFPSFLSFALSVYSYHSPRLVVPLLVIGLIFFYRDKLKTVWKGLLVGLVLFTLLAIPLVLELKSTTGARFGSVTVLNAQERLGSSIQKIDYDEENQDIIGRLTHNRRVVFAREILGGYLDHFNIDFLFLKGDSPGRHHAAGMGMLYLWDLPFVLMGIYFLLKQRNRSVMFIFWWFLAAPVASSLTAGTPHAVRSLMYLPTYQIFITLGFLMFLKSMRENSKKKRFTVIFISSLFFLNFFYYLHMYYIHTPKEYSQWWQYGYKQAVNEISKYENNFNRIIVTYGYDQPYIYLLFYKLIDPVWYQQNWGWGEIMRDERSFGKYEFKKIDWQRDSKLQSTLLVGTPKEIPVGAEGLLTEIKFLDGSVAFRIAGR